MMRKRGAGAGRSKMFFTTASLLAALPWVGVTVTTAQFEVFDEQVEEGLFEEAVPDEPDDPDLPPEMRQILIDIYQDSDADVRAGLLNTYPWLAQAVNAEDKGTADEPDADTEAAPATTPLDELIAEEERRKKAEALIAELAEADDARVVEIEAGLAALGESSLVPLKLAALSDDFELRVRSGQMARRLRWRLASSTDLLQAKPDLPAILASEDQQPRRTLVDLLIADPDSGYVPFFVECLADRDPYIRERGIDGLVKIGEDYNTQKAIAALEQAALTSDDESVVLLAVTGLGDIGKVDMAVMTKLFESTDSAEVQRTVLLTAGYSRQGSALGLVERALKDPRWRVRAAGLETLEDIERNADKTRMGEMVRPLLADPEPFIRATAMRLVSEMDLPGSDEELWQMFTDGKLEERGGLEALAKLKSRKAYAEILKRYRAATQAGKHEDAAAWLTMLGNYESQSDVDQLLKGVLTDRKLRTQWQAAIRIASYRDESDGFLPIVSPMLLDDDAEVRSAVWNGFGRYQMDDYELPAAVATGLAKGDTEQRLWRLHLIYTSRADDITDQLGQALGDSHSEVVNRSLAMIAQLLINDPFGDDQLPYRNASEVYFYDDLGNEQIQPDPVAEKGLSDQVAERLTKLLTHDNILARTRAAALLYHTDKDRGEAVIGALRAAIQSDLPMHQSIALKAASAEPGKLIAGVDLIALTRDQTYQPLLNNASIVMLATGEEKLVAEVLRIAQGIEIRREEAFFLALAQTGSEAAIALIDTKLSDEGSYTTRSFIEELVSLNADAAVTLGQRVFKHSSMDQYDRQRIIRVLMPTKSEKLVPLLESEVERLTNSRDRWERESASQFEQMLLQLDPERAKKQIGEALATGDLAAQQRAIQTLVQMQPNQTLAEFVFESALVRAGEVDPSWSLLVPWLRDTNVFLKLEQSISELPGPMQITMLDELATQTDPANLQTLLAIKPTDAQARDRITMIVAELTTKFPKARPTTLHDSPAQARIYLLAAAGQWDGGEAMIRPWLDDQDVALADAALRGLSIYWLLADEQELEEQDAARFANGVTSADAYTAYLSAEALFQHDPQRLLEIDPQTITSRVALLRVACLKYERSGGPIDLAVDEVLRDPSGAQSTAMRFALIATINAKQSRMFRIARQSAIDYHPDLVPRAAYAFEQYQEFIQAAQAGLIEPGDPTAQPLVDLTLQRLVPRGDVNVGMLIQLGFVNEIPTDQMGFYFDAYARWQANMWGGSDWDTLLRLLDTDDPNLRGTLSEIVSKKRPGSLFAAMLAWQLYEDEPAMQFIVQTAMLTDERALRQSNSDQSQRNAMQFMGINGKVIHATAILEAHAKLDAGDDWRAAQLQSSALIAAARLDPDATRAYQRKLIAEKPAEDNEVDSFRRYNGGDFDNVDLLNVLIIDDADFKERRLVSEEQQLTETLMAARSASTPGGVLAMPPWDAEGNLYNARSSDTLAAEERELTLAWIKGGLVGRTQIQSESFAEEQYDLIPGNAGEATTVLQHESDLLDSMGWDYNTYGVMFNDPDTVSASSFYASVGLISTFLPMHADLTLPTDELGALLTAEDAKVASRAIRAVTIWRATELREQLLAAIGRADSAGLEAAWASALLFGPESVAPIRQRLQSSGDFDERVELACLLVLLGEEQEAKPILDQARRLLAVQQLRGRAMTLEGISAVGATPNPNSRQNDIFFEDDYYSDLPEPAIDGRMADSNARWSTLLRVIDSIEHDGLAQRFDLLPTSIDSGYGMWAVAELPESEDGQIALRRSSSAGLVFLSDGTNGLPIRSLVGTFAPAFAHLNQQEAALFNRSLMQFAGEEMDTQSLESAWRDWLGEHAGDDADTLWRSGVSDAVNDLTDARWWRRSLARARLERLTGQAIEPPVLFDQAAWSTLQIEWRAWSQTDQGASYRAALGAVAVDAGHVDASPTDEAGELAMLVRLAGWGDDVQSLAALHRLELWNDRPALIRAAAAWQSSARPELRVWYLQQASVNPRIYVAADEIE